MANTNSELTNELGCIAGNLPLKAMRVAMENKGLLSKAGALYCGTGKVRNIDVVVKKLDENGNVQLDENGKEMTETVTYDVPVTIAVDPPINGVKNGVTYGIQFTVSTNNTVESAVLIPIQPK